MSNNFYVGQKVVHVPDWSGKYDFRKIFPQIQWPEPNGVYTIRCISESPAYPTGKLAVGLGLVEIPDQIHPATGGTIRWRAKEFRPATFLNIDISIFTKMLTPTDRVTA